jgi:hypothetical protein
MAVPGSIQGIAMDANPDPPNRITRGKEIRLILPGDRH